MSGTADCDNTLCFRLAKTVGDLTGWRRAGTSFAAGILAAAALPPVYAIPVLLVAFPCLIWLIDSSPSWRRAFWDGWWFGFGHFVAGLYWIGHSLLVDAAQFAWLLPFAVLCIPAVLAVYTGIVAVVARCISQGALRVIAFAALWVLVEWARGQLFTGFPWNAIGTVWAVSEPTMQFAAVGGIYALSLLTVFIAASPATLGRVAGRGKWALPVCALAATACLWTYGAVRLSADAPGSVPGVVLRIVQPNIPQRIKWQPDLRDRHLATYLKLSAQPSATRPTHIIWPETAVPFIVSSDIPRRRAMASIIPPDGLLLTGAVRRTPPGVRPFQVWNSFHGIDPAANIVATYDKFHLVPFGEYVPFRGLLDFAKLTAGRTDFTAGPGPRTLALPGLPPVSPLICYEVIFPDNVTAKDARPRWLLNVTNDGWFGTSSGPFQHFAMARFRAVEQGLPLVRAANTGISAVTDAYGRVLAQIGLNEQGVLTVGLPRPQERPTLFSLYGSKPALIFAVSLVVLTFFERRRQ
ncbi:MAG: apolipoprotein N-acyltransferase [Rhodospirillaceae bacterium]|jgi:apolipoprotein N-acyltransferase|nr:apolipoprotein N-acyltransferase [Rhodospirillaceae bacterium]MBT5456336.1 apolipoprotein N-acyltransferase [Rhodospirillaceae bacterium]